MNPKIFGINGGEVKKTPSVEELSNLSLKDLHVLKGKYTSGTLHRNIRKALEIKIVGARRQSIIDAKASALWYAVDLLGKKGIESTPELVKPIISQINTYILPKEAIENEKYDMSADETLLLNTKMTWLSNLIEREGEVIKANPIAEYLDSLFSRIDLFMEVKEW